MEKSGIEIINAIHRAPETMYIKGILFDMDGLVLDTQKLYNRFWPAAANALGYPMSHEQALELRSLNRVASAKKMQEFYGEDFTEKEWERIRQKRIELMEAYIEEHGIEPKPGIQELFSFIKAHSIKTAIVTASPKERALRYLKKVGIDHLFDHILSAQMVENGKPAPDVYLYGAKILGLQPEECMVLEDSPAGIIGANRAKCIPVMVPDGVQPDEETRALMYAKVDSLDLVIDLLK